MIRHYRLTSRPICTKPIAEALERRIAEWLGHPSLDLHGNPIPSAQLELPQNAPSKRLAALEGGEYGIIERVGTQDQDALNLLAHLGLKPGARVEVLEHTTQGTRLRWPKCFGWVWSATAMWVIIKEIDEYRTY